MGISKSRSRAARKSLDLCGDDGDKTAELAAVFEDQGAGDLGEQGVILAAADMYAGLETRATLADDDGPAGDKLSAECFYAKPLCV
jgi:hypothetical protein